MAFTLLLSAVSSLLWCFKQFGIVVPDERCANCTQFKAETEVAVVMVFWKVQAYAYTNIHLLKEHEIWIRDMVCN